MTINGLVRYNIKIMLNKILSTLIIFTVSFILFIETIDHSDQYLTQAHSTVTTIDNFQQVVISKVNHCDDCKNEACSDEETCCVTTCAHSSLVLFTSQKILLISIGSSHEKPIFYNYQIYKSPLLDQALKPPLFS